uniref:Uncharacterized protein n=1 Tax=Amphimedon queenslandica TaxID=400682 RepID=A0A1X7TNF3_AMPQE
MKQLDEKNMLHLIRLSSSDKSTETTASSIAPTVGPTQQGLTNLSPNVKNHGSSGLHSRKGWNITTMLYLPT